MKNPLAKGFYTVPEAARLIQVGSARRIYGWLRGYEGRNIGPLLHRDYQPVDSTEELSFLDLMEVRFVERFKQHGVKMRSLRTASEELRRMLKTDHPFASAKVMLVADKADVYIREALKKTAEKEEDPRLLSLTTRNYVMYEAIKQALLPGVEFDPKTQLTSAWAPLPSDFPTIKIDPKRAFGQPTIERGIPTGTLRDAWENEHEDADIVADYYGISSRDVMLAVRFERQLDASNAKAAA